MTPREIALHRLANLCIAASAARDPAGVVTALGAMQAQDYASSLWAIGLRLAGATLTEVEKAVAARTIVRTWPMRGTLHFVPAPDVRWMLDLLTPRVLAGSVNRQAALELDAAVFARCRQVFQRALTGGRQLTREEMLTTLERGGIPVDPRRGYHILWRLGQEQFLCFGPRAGKQPTFVLLDEWVPASRRLSREESLAELARRYFTSHGPATLRDFVWWSGLKVSDARTAIELSSSSLASETIDGTSYWLPQNSTPRRRQPRRIAARFRRIPPRVSGPRRRPGRHTRAENRSRRQRHFPPHAHARRPRRRGLERRAAQGRPHDFRRSIPHFEEGRKPRSHNGSGALRGIPRAARQPVLTCPDRTQILNACRR
jgi:hypothetical protein